MAVSFAVMVGVNWLPFFFLVGACVFTGIFFLVAFVLPNERVQKFLGRSIKKIWQKIERQYAKRRRKRTQRAILKRIGNQPVDLENAPTLREGEG